MTFLCSQNFSGRLFTDSWKIDALQHSKSFTSAQGIQKVSDGWCHFNTSGHCHKDPNASRIFSTSFKNNRLIVRSGLCFKNLSVETHYDKLCSNFNHRIMQKYQEISTCKWNVQMCISSMFQLNSTAEKLTPCTEFSIWSVFVSVIPILLWYAYT